VISFVFPSLKKELTIPNAHQLDCTLASWQSNFTGLLPGTEREESNLRAVTSFSEIMADVLTVGFFLTVQY